MAERSYAVSNFSEYDHSVLRSIMSLVGARTQNEWVEADSSSAHVVFINVDDAAGRQAWDDVEGRPRVWCTREDEEGGADYVLGLPVRFKTLLPLVERLEADVPDPSAAARPATKSSAPQATGSSPKGGHFRATDGMLGYLERIQQGGMHAVLHTRDYAPLFPPTDLAVDGAAGRFVWPDSDNDLAELCAMPADGIAARKLPEDEYRTYAEATGERPLEVLLWMAAVHGSAGLPMEGLDDDTPVSLSGKPSDLGIPLDNNERKLERQLRGSPQTVDDLATQTGAPDTQIIAFINGCLALGVAQLEAKSA